MNLKKILSDLAHSRAGLAVISECATILVGALSGAVGGVIMPSENVTLNTTDLMTAMMVGNAILYTGPVLYMARQSDPNWQEDPEKIVINLSNYFMINGFVGGLSGLVGGLTLGLLNNSENFNFIAGSAATGAVLSSVIGIAGVGCTAMCSVLLSSHPEDEAGAEFVEPNEVLFQYGTFGPVDHQVAQLEAGMVVRGSP